MYKIKIILASKDLNFQRNFEHLSFYKCKGKFPFKTEMVKLNAIVRKLFVRVGNIQKKNPVKKRNNN